MGWGGSKKQKVFKNTKVWGYFCTLKGWVYFFVKKEQKYKGTFGQ